jgi:hypothetical protein
LSFVAASFGAGVVLTSLFGSRLREALTGQRSGLVLLPRTGEFLGVGTGLATVLVFASFLPMAAAVSFFSSALQNVATLFVPTWMAHSADRRRGVAVLGQRMLFSVALGLALLLASVPSALLVGRRRASSGGSGSRGAPGRFRSGGCSPRPLCCRGWLLVQVGGASGSGSIRPRRSSSSAADER